MSTFSGHFTVRTEEGAQGHDSPLCKRVLAMLGVRRNRAKEMTASRAQPGSSSFGLRIVLNYVTGSKVCLLRVLLSSLVGCTQHGNLVAPSGHVKPAHRVMVPNEILNVAINDR